MDILRMIIMKTSSTVAVFIPPKIRTKMKRSVKVNSSYEKKNLHTIRET